MKKVHLLMVNQTPKRSQNIGVSNNLPLREWLVPLTLVTNCTAEPLPNLHMEEKLQRIYSPLKLWYKYLGRHLGKDYKVDLCVYHDTPSPKRWRSDWDLGDSKTLSDKRKNIMKLAKMVWFCDSNSKFCSLKSNTNRSLLEFWYGIELCIRVEMPESQNWIWSVIVCFCLAADFLSSTNINQ
jgi:hypothetical protein